MVTFLSRKKYLMNFLPREKVASTFLFKLSVKHIKMPITIATSTMDFLKNLSKNNDREWFNKNKNLYVAAHENVLVFVDALLSEMRKHDLIETRTAKESLFRIYRDVRFSKDKSPYKSYWAGHFKRATKK